MSHHHDEHHAHDASQTSAAHGSPSEMEKLIKMIHHWIHHNEDHAHSYREWAQRAKALGQEQAASVLMQVARQTEEQNQNMEQALELLTGAPSPH